MLVVSNYHYIRESFDYKYPSIFGITPEKFEKQLIELSKHGTFISQGDLIKDKDKPFDKNYILITFDDGLAEQYHLAKPILDKMGIPFVCFINSINHTDKEVSLVHQIHLLRSQICSKEILAYISENFSYRLTAKDKELAKKNYFYDDEASANLKYLLNFRMGIHRQKKVVNTLFNQNFDEQKVRNELYLTDHMLKDLYQNGNLGSHSHQHIPLGNYHESIIEEEFLNSQKFFKKTFGEKAYSISYPYGSKESCNKVSEIGKKHGFEIGFSMERAANDNLVNPLMISRFDSNDLPLGKNNIFEGSDNLFTDIKTAEWYR